MKDHNGNEFKTIEELADFYGVNVRALKSRLKRGMSLQEAIDKSGFIIDAYGRKFKTVKQFCNYYRITKQTYDENIAKGITSVQLSVLIKSIRGRQEYEAFDKKQEMNDAYFKKLMEEKKNKRRCYKEFDFEGKHFNSMSDLCAEYHIKYNTFMKRQRKGWSLNDCVYGKPKKVKESKPSKVKGFDYNGKHFKNNVELCEYYKIDYFAFTRRRKRGLSIEECMKEDEAKYFVYGKKFNSLKQIANYFNVNINTLNKYYYANDKNINKAVTLAIKNRNDIDKKSE